jgi:polyhydroxyalkanoate synthesis regulator phasin
MSLVDLTLPCPCPFCGSAVGVVERVERFGEPPDDATPAEGWWDYYVRCISCSCEGPPSKSGAQGAMREWVQRPGHAAGRSTRQAREAADKIAVLRARVADLEAETDRLRHYRTINNQNHWMGAQLREALSGAYGDGAESMHIVGLAQAVAARLTGAIAENEQLRTTPKDRQAIMQPYIPKPEHTAEETAAFLREEIARAHRAHTEAERILALDSDDAYTNEMRRRAVALAAERLTTLRRVLQWLTRELWS